MNYEYLGSTFSTIASAFYNYAQGEVEEEETERANLQVKSIAGQTAVIQEETENIQYLTTGGIESLNQKKENEKKQLMFTLGAIGLVIITGGFLLLKK